MKGLYDGYRDIGCGDEAYFIGANTGRGFVNSSLDALSETVLERLYILKGGAGTGKSTLLKRIAAEGAKNGYSVVLYRCGSDYESLDAVIIDGKVGVVDGTSPHVWEMKYPGACSTIVDVSKHLNGEFLRDRVEEIKHLSERKAEAYASAYRYLRAAEVLAGEISDTTDKAADWKKLRSYAERTAKKLCGKEKRKASGKTPTVNSVYIGSVSMRGLAYLPTLAEKAGQIVSVRDVYGFASEVLRELGDAFTKRGFSVVYGRIPLNDRIKELYLPEISLLFSVNGEGDSVKRINTERFLRKEQVSADAGRLKLTVRCIRALLDESIDCMKAAGEAHFGLEEINKAAMEWSGLKRYSNQVISDIMGKLTTS